MAKLAIIFILIAVLFFVHRSVVVSGQCHLDFPLNRRNMPSYKKSFGSKSIKIFYRHQHTIIHEDEHIDVYCASGISDFHDVYEERGDSYPYRQEKRSHLISGMRRVNIYCKDQKLHYTDGHALLENELTCSDLKWNMYESAEPFTWCESNMTSYLLVSKSLGMDLVLAATCFDIEKIAIRNLYYFTGPNTYTVDLNELPVVTPSELSNVTLGAEVTNFQTIFEISGKATALQADLTAKSVHNPWLKVAQFEYHSLVAGTLYAEYFKAYGSLLDIVWWPSLRDGNWRRFVDALDKRANSHAYNIYAGTSGVVRVPQRNQCSPSDILELPFGDVNHTIPAYVWTYVQAVDGSEEFVVVGYNSPFFNFYVEDEIIFCVDICSNIDWLDDVRSTFRYAPIGVIFCCGVDAVRAADSLDGFPLKVEPPTTTTVEPIMANVTKDPHRVRYYNWPSYEDNE